MHPHLSSSQDERDGTKYSRALTLNQTLRHKLHKKMLQSRQTRHTEGRSAQALSLLLSATQPAAHGHPCPWQQRHSHYSDSNLVVTSPKLCSSSMMVRLFEAIHVETHLCCLRCVDLVRILGDFVFLSTAIVNCSAPFLYSNMISQVASHAGLDLDMRAASCQTHEEASRANCWAHHVACCFQRVL